MKKTLVLFLSAILFGILCQTALADSGKEKTADAAARAWLSRIDQRIYAESGTEAASFFKRAVTAESWKQSMQSFLHPRGKIRSRKLVSSKYTRTLPGAPDGEYVVIQYQASFE